MAIDVLRSICIVSMATAHLAAGSISWHIFHAGVWIDGAVGFVFLSGLMVGVTQRRVIERSGRAAGQRKLLRRCGVVYLAHLALCLVAMVAVALAPERAGPYSGVTELGGPLPALGSLLTLRVNPWSASILSLYVVLILLAILAVPLLVAGRWTLLLGSSAVLYAAGIIWPQQFSLPIQPGVPGAANWASWQLLFMLAALAGWNWPAVRSWLARPLVAVTSGCVLGALVVLAYAATGGESIPWKPVADLLFSDGTLGVGRIVMAIAAGVLLYRLAQAICRRPSWPIRLLATIGRRSLDCYLILSVVVIVLPLASRYLRSGLAANAVVLGVLLACLGWCLARDAKRTRSMTSSL